MDRHEPGGINRIGDTDDGRVMGAARELTVEEIIDRRIEKLERQTKALRDLKGNLPSNYLQSGAHRILAFIEL